MNTRVLMQQIRMTARSAERRARLQARLRKSLGRRLGPARTSRAIFVAGMQRSGTGMLMNVFHLHPGIAVFDEAPDTSVYRDFRVRSIDALRSSLEEGPYEFAAYKIICDSHIVTEFLDAFPHSKVVWMYREPQANADSQLRKFSQPVRAIKLVHAGKPGGGWLAEGASDDSVRILRALDARTLSDLDWSCLNWWLRNRAYFDQRLESDTRVRLLRYESAVASPREVLGEVTDWLGLPRDDSASRFVTVMQTGQVDQPALHPDVHRLCRSLLVSLDAQHHFSTPHDAGAGSPVR